MTDDKSDDATSEVVIAEEVNAEEVVAEEVVAEAGDAPPRRDRQRLLAFVLLPALVVLLGAVAGFLKWESEAPRADETAAVQSVAAARDTTTAILSYNAGTVEKELNAARERLTGSFLDAYTKLVNDVVIPGAKEKKISAAVQVPAAASVSATPTHAVALVFVNQTTSIANDAPTNTTSSVRVTLDKVGDRWLVSGFDPV
ncbi:MAG: hypothetical protein ACOYEV_03350 [Candidatus Nanopelagicales bacterium]